MRLFQNSRYYRSLEPLVRRVSAKHSNFSGKIGAFMALRDSAAHILQPLYDGEEWAFFTHADDEEMQRTWARENGLKPSTSLADIVRAQIEDHRADVFYNSDSASLPDDFARNLPGCVRKTVVWHASAYTSHDFAAYDRVVCNFPFILEEFRRRGCKTTDFFPGHDPAMAPYARNEERPVDILFVGGYSRHHQRRAKLLEAIAGLTGQYNVRLHLDRGRLCKLAESPVGQLLPLAKHRRPAAVRKVSKDGVFGLDLYQAVSTAKIVVNGSIDMAGPDRGNLRCFETMGCGSLLLSDEGNYPDGMRPGETVVTYSSVDNALAKIADLLKDEHRRRSIAQAGYQAISSTYSKDAQWRRFEEIIAEI